MKIKLCKNCKWSKPHGIDLQCFNPTVTANDPDVLSSPEVRGTYCKLERSLKGTAALCGIRGYLFEEK